MTKIIGVIIIQSYRVTSEAIAEMFESLGHPERIKAIDELYNPDVAISMKGDCYDNNFRHLQQD